MDFLLQGCSLEFGALLLLLLALVVALGFEFINGFHDTANAVATVIYTNSLKPTHAVLLSGFFNFLGVMISGVGVAYAVVNLLPVDLLVEADGGRGFAMTFAVLLSAVIWNLGTWYYGIPASSSHTLIGAIIGVGIVHSAQSVHWDKAAQVGLSLLISPLIGFLLAGAVLLGLKKFVDNEELYQEPEGDKPPPLWIRAILIFTCSGVSLAHGSNDGQKGMGLIMLILIGMVPAGYAINVAYPADQVRATAAAVQDYTEMVSPSTESTEDPNEILTLYLEGGQYSARVLSATRREAARIQDLLTRHESLSQLPEAERWELRTDVILLSGALKKLKSEPASNWTAAQVKKAEQVSHHLDGLTLYVATWVKVAVALALGCGTMIGWKRIVVTVGEKIGKTHLTYAQGAAAELVAMTTIGLADIGGLPVSTTHVLSSGVAGTMVANKSGVQGKTVKNILWAWVLTLPVCIALSAGLFVVFCGIFG